MMVGGFTSSWLMAHLSLSFWVSLPLAGLTAGLAGLVFGIPSLRVKGFYLAMATLAAQFIIPWLSEHTFKEFLGGSSGLIRTPVPAIGAYEFLNAARYAHITLVVVILTTVVAHNISRTRLGRSFVAVRDNDLAAELLGVNPFTTKLKAFFIASVFAGIAGSLQAHFQRGVGTEYGYDLVTSIFLLGMLVVGGIGSNIGPFLGAAAIILLEDFSAWLGVYLAGTFPAQATALLPSFRPILFGTLLMLFLIFEPRGIAWRWRLFLTAWRLRPFAR
jgi:branched-chain amino acid transport system permease protein